MTTHRIETTGWELRILWGFSSKHRCPAEKPHLYSETCLIHGDGEKYPGGDVARFPDGAYYLRRTPFYVPEVRPQKKEPHELEASDGHKGSSDEVFSCFSREKSGQRFATFRPKE